MNLFRPPAAVLLALAACGSPQAPPPHPLADPAADARRARDGEIVALHDGRPLTWREVAERAMETDLRQAVDQCVRGRIVEERRAALGIVNTPAEIRRRAEAVVRQAREGLGEAALRERLSREGFTEEAYLDHLAGSRLLDQTLVLEKIARYEETVGGSLEIDRMTFVDEKDALRFAESCREKGFDGAADAFRGTGPVTRRPRETFPRGSPPAPPDAPPLDPPIVEALGRMKPGEVTGAVASRSRLFYVIRLVASRPGREVPYPEVKDEVFESILRSPPAPPEIRRWIETRFAGARIEYADRRPAGGRNR